MTVQSKFHFLYLELNSLVILQVLEMTVTLLQQIHPLPVVTDTFVNKQIIIVLIPYPYTTAFSCD